MHRCPERCVRMVLSDIDGTLVFTYPPGAEADQRLRKAENLALPPSRTGRRGFISKRTIELCGRLRKKGIPLVLISGVRYSTFAQRLKYLPYADAYVIENGGRIFYPAEGSERRSGNLVVGPEEKYLVEDEDWRITLAEGSGDASQDFLTPGERIGPLWDLYRQLVKAGCTVDTHTYYTMIRVSAGDGGRELEEAKRNLPSELSCSSNFGLTDFFPSRSGKRQAALYLAKEKFGIDPEFCAALCDDDNDIEMAEAVGHAFVTTFSSDSIARAARARPDHFTVASSSDVKASEEVLSLALARCHPREEEHS